MNTASVSNSRRPAAVTLVALLAAVLLAAVGCDSDKPPASWSSVSMDAQPPLFEIRHEHPALVELEGLYLGQPHDEALATLKSDYCPHPVRRDARLGDDAYFLGCRLEDHPTLKFIRVGFWPRIGERLATVEVKRAHVPPAAVYRRFVELEFPVARKTLQPALIRVVTPDYRMAADWDEGLDGPAHIVVGFDPDYQP